jgi:hypothetical protein
VVVCRTRQASRHSSSQQAANKYTPTAVLHSHPLTWQVNVFASHATQVVSDIATMSDQPRLKIRIPEAAWNAYNPRRQLPPRRVKRAAIRAASSTTSSTAVLDKRGKIEKNPSGPPPSSVETITKARSCKVRLWGFHHGGPKRVIKGALQNEVTYETPCLQPTCANCWKWHPHLMREQTRPYHFLGDTLPENFSPNIYSSKPEIEPLSPPIDPSILDGTWQSYQSRRRSSSASISITSNEMNALVLTPVKTSFSSDLDHHSLPFHVNSSSSSRQFYNIYLPTQLLSQTITSAPATTKWRSAPRKRYTIRLAFASHGGRGKFRDLVRKRERRAKRREYDRLYRARKAGKGRGRAVGKRREREG